MVDLFFNQLKTWIASCFPKFRRPRHSSVISPHEAKALGDRCLEGKQLKEAERWYSYILDSESPGFDSLSSAILFFLSQDNAPKIEQGLVLLKKECDENPRDDKLVFCGDIAIYFGRTDEMEKCFPLVLENSPFKAPLYYKMGCNYFMLGHFSKAREAFRNAQKEMAQKKEERQLDKLDLTFLAADQWATRIGHLGLLDGLIKLRKLDFIEDKNHVLLASSSQIACPALIPYLEPHISVVTDPGFINNLRDILPYTQQYVNFFSLKDGSCILLHEMLDRVNREWEDAKLPRLFELDHNHQSRGWDNLASWGIKKGESWFVTLHVRTGIYYNEPDSVSVRNADIETYEKAIRLIRSRGGHVIWLGDGRELPKELYGLIIDYPHSGMKSDWMDLFLCAECRFFMGVDSGISVIPDLFDVPCVLTNWIPCAMRPWKSKNLWIPKLIQNETTGENLLFQELLGPPVGYWESHLLFKKRAYRIIDNSPEEITEVAEEMLDFLEGRAFEDTQADERQQRFQTIARTQQSYGAARVGGAFLRRYESLLR
ncbi:putative glycosyltransferase, TIGR04372 family [Verrucomicrobium sp. GAS474]|uniref:TIGR04372 family glycosyltransferase n=1 Tax=Verrucomicrobium sp. GAS474 TaxID=1882831 RepID=UPI00087DE2CD|nr:TIGR04372 family glycosyltransferase [Verrucomicrobium sp. GAS474]SDT94537.1 putative glycosyltransferase, TIGR04372 family [Verrucomicrobium sp. GAS474]